MCAFATRDDTAPTPLWRARSHVLSSLQAGIFVVWEARRWVVLIDESQSGFEFYDLDTGDHVKSLRVSGFTLAGSAMCVTAADTLLVMADPLDWMSWMLEINPDEPKNCRRSIKPVLKLCGYNCAHAIMRACVDSGTCVVLTEDRVSRDSASWTLRVLQCSPQTPGSCKLLKTAPGVFPHGQSGGRDAQLIPGGKQLVFATSCSPESLLRVYDISLGYVVSTIPWNVQPRHVGLFGIGTDGYLVTMRGTGCGLLIEKQRITDGKTVETVALPVRNFHNSNYAAWLRDGTVVLQTKTLQVFTFLQLRAAWVAACVHIEYNL